MRRLAAALAVLVLFATPTVLVADSPYAPNVEREAPPFAPERPATFDRETASAYLVAYERTRLVADLLAARGYTLDRGDVVRRRVTSRTSPGPTPGTGSVSTAVGRFGTYTDSSSRPTPPTPSPTRSRRSR